MIEAKKIRLIIIEPNPVCENSLTRKIIQSRYNVVGRFFPAEFENRFNDPESMNKTMDVILIGLESQGKDESYSMIERCKTFAPVPTIVVSDDESEFETDFLKCLTYGVRGFILEQDLVQYLDSALPVVVGGKYSFSPLIAPGLENAPERNILSQLDDILSKREREVLQCMGEGMNARDSGERLNISTRTVEYHRLNISGKLEGVDVNFLAKFGVRDGSLNYLSEYVHELL